MGDLTILDAIAAEDGDIRSGDNDLDTKPTLLTSDQPQIFEENGRIKCLAEKWSAAVL